MRQRRCRRVWADLGLERRLRCILDVEQPRCSNARRRHPQRNRMRGLQRRLNFRSRCLRLLRLRARQVPWCHRRDVRSLRPRHVHNAPIPISEHTLPGLARHMDSCSPGTRGKTLLQERGFYALLIFSRIAYVVVGRERDWVDKRGRLQSACGR